MIQNVYTLACCTLADGALPLLAYMQLAQHSHSWPTCSWHPSVVLCDTECNMETCTLARTHFAQHGDVLAYMQLAPLCEHVSHNILRVSTRHHARHTWHTSRVQVLHASCRNTCHTTCTCTCTWYTTWHTMLHTCTRAREDICTHTTSCEAPCDITRDTLGTHGCPVTL